MAHELRTPLASLREYTALAMDGIGGEVPPGARDFLSLSLTSCDELSRLIDDLFDTARIETGKLRLKKRKADLEAVLCATTRRIESRARDAELALMVDTGDSLPHFEFDPLRVSQLLANLLVNAITHTPAGGAIRVRACYAEREALVTVTVADNGYGIALEDQPRIFERTYQAGGSDSLPKPGLGIGLHLGATIVNLHGGQIWVESEPGAGATFSFTLPVAGTA